MGSGRRALQSEKRCALLCLLRLPLPSVRLSSLLIPPCASPLLSCSSSACPLQLSCPSSSLSCSAFSSCACSAFSHPVLFSSSAFSSSYFHGALMSPGVAGRSDTDGTEFELRVSYAGTRMVGTSSCPKSSLTRIVRTQSYQSRVGRRIVRT